MKWIKQLIPLLAAAALIAWLFQALGLDWADLRRGDVDALVRAMHAGADAGGLGALPPRRGSRGVPELPRGEGSLRGACSPGDPPPHRPLHPPVSPTGRGSGGLVSAMNPKPHEGETS